MGHTAATATKSLLEAKYCQKDERDFSDLAKALKMHIIAVKMPSKMYVMFHN